MGRTWSSSADGARTIGTSISPDGDGLKMKIHSPLGAWSITPARRTRKLPSAYSRPVGTPISEARSPAAISPAWGFPGIGTRSVGAVEGMNVGGLALRVARSASCSPMLGSLSAGPSGRAEAPPPAGRDTAATSTSLARVVTVPSMARAPTGPAKRRRRRIYRLRVARLRISSRGRGAGGDHRRGSRPIPSGH